MNAIFARILVSKSCYILDLCDGYLQLLKVSTKGLQMYNKTLYSAYSIALSVLD